MGGQIELKVLFVFIDGSWHTIKTVLRRDLAAPVATQQLLFDNAANQLRMMGASTFPHLGEASGIRKAGLWRAMPLEFSFWRVVQD